jgi:spore maturation protein CgeB
MRIFYASGTTPNSALPDSQLWRDNLLGALVDLGHDVVEFDYDLEPLLAAANVMDPANRRTVEQKRPEAARELLRQVRGAHEAVPLDLFFSYFYSSCTTPETIRAIRELGIKTVNWYCNASYQLDLVAEIAPSYDACLVPERFRLDDYRRLGARPIYCQEAANPRIYHPRDIARDLDVTFVGARYADRPAYIRRLVDADVPVRVFGPGWGASSASRASARRQLSRARQLTTRAGWTKLRRKVARLGSASDGPPLPPEIYGGVLSDHELVATYSRSKIVLGFSTVGQTHRSSRLTQIRLRDFEVPMSGAFYMVEHLPELEDFFEVGREIVTYAGADELVEKCRYYLAHADDRERIRRAGHARALADHTWQRRLSDAFTQLDLPS